MSAQHVYPQGYTNIFLRHPLRMLNPDLITKIDDALCQVGAFGEVGLIIVKGKLRFIKTVASESVDDLPQARSRP